MSKKKKSTGKKRLTKKALRRKVLSVFHDNPRRGFNYKQLANILDITNNSQKTLINDLLGELKEIGKLDAVKTGKYKLKEKGNIITGKVELSGKGWAYIHTEDVKEDVYVKPENLQHALHGDEVEVYVFAHRKGGRLYGEITKINKRGKSTFVGRVERSKNYAFLIPDSRNMPYDIFIPIEQLGGAKSDQKAIVEISDWPESSKNPVGKVIEVLGNVGENEVEMHAILAEFELPYGFPDEVDKAAEDIPDTISDEEIKKRRDFRDVLTFTIDPADAKDFDDAISYRKLDNGHVEVGVHIADVSHYVRPGTIVDDEGYERATSVYLVDRVVPMLPERLSNNICSLRPNEEKLAFSAVFEMNNRAEIINEWFGRTVIKSDRRFAYEEAQEIIDTNEGELADEMLHLNRLAQFMRRARFNSGSISFDRIEVKFNIADDGTPLGVSFKQMKEANQLIEEFMLLANRRVAEFVGKPAKNKKIREFVYRVHDEPDQAKLKSFNTFIKKFGYRIKTNSAKQTADSMNLLFQEIEGRSEQNVIEQLAIRSMAKAEYATDNIGHYGLGFDYYTHFTSPIRRYPDLMVHRILAEILEGQPPRQGDQYSKPCQHVSEMEKRAVMAERASIKYKQVEYMQDKVGQVYEGIISGVTEWGLFVEIVENKVEGLVSIRDMEDDFYSFDEENYRLIGKHLGKIYTLGDPIKIVIVRTNLRKKQLDFELADEELSQEEEPEDNE